MAPPWTGKWGCTGVPRVVWSPGQQSERIGTAKAFGVASPKGTDAALRFFWPVAFRERHAGPKVSGSITTTDLLSVPSFLSQFPPLATKNKSSESMAGGLGEAESILAECGKESNEGIQFETATCKKTSLWRGLECSPAGLRQAGASGSSLGERGGQGGHTRVFFLVPKGQAGYSSEVLVTEIKRNCYLNKSGLLEKNKEKSLLYIK